MSGVTFREMLAHFGVISVVEPAFDLAWQLKLIDEFENGERTPHGRPWHVSFHASEFPGDSKNACARAAVYKLMDIGSGVGDRWLQNTAEVGKALELANVRAIRDTGRLVRCSVPGMSTDPDARDEAGELMPQIGFIDSEHWLTGSIDLPMLAIGEEDRPHIVEHKTKHENAIKQMQFGMKGPNAEHRRQLMCSLGLAHENADAFTHPFEDRALLPAREGSVYYQARDTEWMAGGNEVASHSFLFEHSPEFMNQGRAHLKRFKQAFLDGEIPEDRPFRKGRDHPFGWMWSQGLCQYCDLKKICQTDYRNHVVKLEKSSAIAVAMFTRGGYDHKAIRARVIGFWDDIEKKENQ
jgi:hypothetical protein